jgi:hypothetical protein
VAIAVAFNWKLYVPSSQSFVAKETFPVNVPAVAELNITLKVVVAPAATVVVPKEDPNVKFVPVTVIGAVNVKLEVPVLVIVNVAVVGAPANTEP